MRFIAAALVFVSHSPTLHAFADPGIANPYGRFAPQVGFNAVEFFFILSGFVLTWSARPDDTARSFWWRRFVKIYPNNVVACGLALLGLLVTGQAISAVRTVPNLFLVQDWWPNVPLSGGINGPSWSLACEVLFYALFPVLLPLVHRVPDRLLWPLAGVVVGLVALLPTISTLLLPDHPAYQGGLSFPQYWFVYVFPFSRLLEFVLGIVVARLVLAGRWLPVGFGPAVAIACGAFALTEFAPFRYALVTTMIVPLALVIGAGAEADRRGTRSLVRGRVAVFLGEVSYAFYLVHWLVLTFGKPLLHQQRWSWPVAVGVMLAFFCVALGLATALYLTVERPLVRAAARRARTVRAARTAAAA